MNFLLLALVSLAHAANAGSADVATVAAGTVSARYQAYAQVEPPLAWGNTRPQGCAVSEGLWLKAAFYGGDLNEIRPGLKGIFVPAGSSRSVPVKVCANFGLLRADGGEPVAMLAVSAKPDWQNGMFGTVTLSGPPRTLPKVPTRALVLDQGRWWVLVRAPSGDAAREVQLGPARGWDTFIESGLAAGDQVVVSNAYLEYHRNVAQAYQPPN